jgi:hypothetical protein
MRYLVFLLAFLATPAWAECNSDDIVTTGATFGARATDGRPLITIEGVGGVSVTHRGDGSGGFTLARECDPAHAARLRADLELLLKQESVASN